MNNARPKKTLLASAIVGVLSSPTLVFAQAAPDANSTEVERIDVTYRSCLLYTSPSPRD